MKGKDGQNMKALLPNHEPSDSVWEKIEAQLNYKERHFKTSSTKGLEFKHGRCITNAAELINVQYRNPSHFHDKVNDEEVKNKRAGELTKKLPAHTPSDKVWNEIEHKLNAAEMRSRLPQYTPADNLWNDLHTNSEIPDTAKSKRKIAFKWAAVLIFLLGSALILRNVLNDTPKLEYHVEWEDAREPAAADTDHSSFGSEGIEGNELIEQLCQRSQATCATPEFKKLETELVELETARAEIKAQLNPYSDNSKLERMLVHIELEHSKVVNEMTQKLL